MKTILAFLLVQLCIVIAAGAAFPLKPAKPPVVPYFLPNDTIPTHYEIYLNVFFNDSQNSYDGVVLIDVNVQQSVSKIVLHAEGITVDAKNSTVWSSGKSVAIKSIETNPTNRFLTINLKKKITTGSHVLELHFNGTYNNVATRSLFKSYYTDLNGTQHALVGTHFEPVRAREMFPCFDEPNLKATFSLNIAHSNNYTAISNMPVESISDLSNDTVITKFRTTPKMSTYLLALAVSDFDSLEETYNGLKIHLYASPDRLNETKFALNVSKEAVRHFEDLLKVPYPLPNLDGVVVPAFGGGMENWGLIVYGDMVLLAANATPKSSTIDLLCHEIAHQWFGNLVTLDWWDYVWLNEGFATFYANRIADLITPEGRFMETLVASYQSLMDLESYREIQDGSLNVHVENPLNISSKFGTISYNKGSAITRFMSLVFPNYDRAISNYLLTNAFENTVPTDLFNALNDMANLPDGTDVATIMTNWVDTPGLPLLTVNATHNGNTTTLVISQERFLFSGQSDAKWWIPINLISKSNPQTNISQPIAWISDQESSISVNVSSVGGDWIIANYKQAVYCRINYDLENWQRITDFLNGPNFEQIDALNRIALIQDVQHLAKLGKLPQSYALNLLSYLKQEQDPLVKQNVLAVFVEYADLLRDSPAFYKFKLLMETIYGQESDKILAPPNMYQLVNEALKAMHSRRSGNVEKIAEVIQRTHTTSSLQNIISSFKKRSFEFNEESDDLLALEKLAIERFENIHLMRMNFYKHQYVEVAKWLNANF